MVSKDGVQMDPRWHGRRGKAAFCFWSSSSSWLEIPGNVIYMTSEPNHSARNPSSRSKPFNDQQTDAGEGGRWRTAIEIRKKTKNLVCWEMGGGEDGARKSSHCGCLFENTSAWQNAFIPSSPFNYGIDALSNVSAQHVIFLWRATQTVDGLLFHWHTWVNRALLQTYGLRTNL